MNRLLTSALFLVAVVLGAMPAKAVTIGYNTSGSTANVTLTKSVTGNISFPGNSSFQLNEKLKLGNGGDYGQAYTYIAFTVAEKAYLNATVKDLHQTDSNAQALKWLSLSLYTYNGSGNPTLGCGAGGALCTLVKQDVDPPTASISAALLAGTQYLLRVGFGLKEPWWECGDVYGGIKLAVATTPIPPALLMFMSALLGMGGVAWQRRRSVPATA